jgi:hypothetical protein
MTSSGLQSPYHAQKGHCGGALLAQIIHIGHSDRRRQGAPNPVWRTGSEAPYRGVQPLFRTAFSILVPMSLSTLRQYSNARCRTGSVTPFRR